MTDTRELLPLCPACGSGNIKLGIVWDGGGEGLAGLYYQTKWTMHRETACSDLCLDCGLIVRTYVMNTGRDWVTYASNQE